MSVTNFASRDFSTIRADLLARASTIFPEWTDRDPADFGMLLVDLWAHSADVLHYYIDRAAGEAFLNTATQRESVLAVANLLDYNPRGRNSATSALSLQNLNSTVTPVPAYTTFILRNDSKSYQAFTTSAASVPANGVASLLITEGTRHVDEVLTTSATGTSGQRYSLSSVNVSTGSVSVNVYEDGVTPTSYFYVSRMTAAPAGARAFTLYNTADGVTQVVFGSALNGLIPPVSAKVTATYIESSGAEGNLPANCVTGFAGTTLNGIVITGNTTFSGGIDEESMASLKLSIPSSVSAQNRAVTRADFVAMAQQVSGVAKASIAFVPGLSAASAGSASAGTNASVTVYPQTTRADFLTTTDTFQTVSAQMKLDVVNTLQPLALLGVTVISASTINWTPIDIQVNVFVQDRYVQQWVKQDVQTALDELFSFDNVFFGQRLHLGQVYRIINGVAGVDYAIVTRFDTTGLTGVQSQVLIDPLKLPKKGTVVLSMSGGTTTT